MKTEDAEATARLIERLLADPGFRATFRKDPAQACRDAGLDQLADDMALAGGKAMLTLDGRESSSSLAGVLMAAAMEGVAFAEFSEGLLPHLESIPNAIGDVLSRVNLPALPGRGALASAPAVAEQAPAASALPADPLAGVDAPGAAAAADVPAPQPPPEEASAEEALAEEAEAEELAEEAPGAPEPPEDDPEMAATDAPEDAPEDGAEADAAEDTATEPTTARQALDPAEFGAEGKGGDPSPEALALLENDKVILDSVGVADVKAGRIDPRIIGVLTKLSEDHEITVSCICSDHSKFTSGGSISNHHLGRGLDIAAIDGVPVNPSSFDAREVAESLSELDPTIRPSEIGSPWAIAGPGYFTDGGHQDHLHVGFDTAIDPAWKPPADLAAGGGGGGEAADGAGITPGVPAVTGSPAPSDDTLGFRAVTAERKGSGGASMVFAAVSPGGAPVQGDEAANGGGGGGGGGGETPDLSGVADGYPGDDAPKAELAAWLAKQAEKRGLPPELPVMAALVESGVQNLSGGHADSVGFFQMRVGIWNQGEYAGYPDNPGLQAKWFLDTAEQVKNQRVANGLPIDDPKQYGVWIADVERPAEQYRGRYQERLEEARALLEQAGGGSSAPEEAAAAAPADAAPVEVLSAPAEATSGEAGGAEPAVARVAAVSDAPAAAKGGDVQGVVSPQVELGAQDSMAFAAVEAPDPPKKAATVQFLQAVDPAQASDAAPGSPMGGVDALADAAAGGGGSTDIVKLAEGEVGQTEAPSGSNDSPRIAEYRKAVPGGPVGPWCAYFTSWAAKEAGTPLGDNGQGFAAVDDVWAWGERTGRTIPSGSGDPRPGDLIVWDEHIGIVEKVAPDGTIHTIEGNSGDAVNRRAYQPGGPIIGFVRPGEVVKGDSPAS